MRDLFELILRSATSPDLIEDALDAFCMEFGVGSSSLLFVRDFSTHGLSASWGGKLRNGEATKSRELFESGGDIDDQVIYRAQIQKPSMRFFSEVEILDLKDQKHLPPSAIREMLAKEGLGHRFGARLNSQGPWADIMSFHALDRTQTKDALKDRRVDLVLPLFSHSITMGRMFSELRSRYGAALTVLDRLGLGVFIVSKENEVIEKNREAKRILSLGDGIKIDRYGKLVAHDTETSASILKAISGSFSVFESESKAPEQTINLKRPSEDLDFLATVCPLFDHRAELEIDLRCVFVLVIDPSRPNPLSVDGLVQLGRLSPKERELAELLVRGHRLSEAADRRGVSIETVRNQFKSIAAKLRCSSQSDVIRIAAATRLPLE